MFFANFWLVANAINGGRECDSIHLHFGIVNGILLCIGTFKVGRCSTTKYFGRRRFEGMCDTIKLNGILANGKEQWATIALVILRLAE